MNMTVIDHWEDPESWNRFVDDIAGAAAYHRFEWRELYRDVFHQPTQYLGVARGGSLTGVLPLVRMRTVRGERMLVSLPYVNYAGVCSDDPESAASLWRRAVELARDSGCRWIESRDCAPRPPADEGIVSRHKVREYLPLPDTPEALWNEFPPKLRSQIRKAWKNGLREGVGGPELIPAFHEVYLRNMRFLGSPPLPRCFFEWIADRFRDRVTICTVGNPEQTIAAAFLLGSRRSLEIPWAACCPRQRSSAATMLLYWTAIRFAVESGFRIFDMGRSTPGTGSHRFKRQWGGITLPLEWTYWQRQPPSLPFYTQADGRWALARRVWRTLPLWLTATLGPRLIRHIPS
jgi:serine/alanine adding enzyme